MVIATNTLDLFVISVTSASLKWLQMGMFLYDKGVSNKETMFIVF